MTGVTQHTEESAERADSVGITSPLISLAHIHRLEIGRICLSDVVEYAKLEGVPRTGIGNEAKENDRLATRHLPAIPRAYSSGAEGIFGRKLRAKDPASRSERIPRRHTAVPLKEGSIVSAYLSTVPAQMDTATPSRNHVVTAQDKGLVAGEGSRKERVANHNSWLMRKEGERGNSWKILELLQAGVPANSKDEDGRTACHLAAMNNYSKAIIALANPHQDSYAPHNFEDAAHDGATALHYAAFNGSLEAAKTVMKMHRANIQAVRFKERDADAERLNQNRHQLHQCEMHLQALRASIEDLEANDLELTLQVQALTDQMAQEEVRHQLDLERLALNQTMTENQFEDHSEQCMKLEKTVAHWKPISNAKYEAFRAEAEKATIELSKLESELLECVSNVEKENKDHGKFKRKLSRQLLQAEQSLHNTQEVLKEKNAIESETVKINEKLLDENKKLSLAVADLSRKVVHVCKSKHHVEFNNKIHATSADGSTPLHWAADSGQDLMCELLLKCGADSNAQDAQGLTPLHWVAIATPHASSIPEPKVARQYLNTCFQLLASGARCNALDQLANSPLHYAARSGFTEFIEVLKEWGGDASLQNHAGATPLHYALANEPPHLEAAHALVAGIKDIYAVIHAQDVNGMSPLHYANVKGYEELAAQLVQHCNGMQLLHSQEAIRQARMGTRDAAHKQLSQLVGAHVMTGSTDEHQRYYHSTLVPTRKKGWTRNDLVHAEKPNMSVSAVSASSKLRVHHLFESLSSSVTKLVPVDDCDMIALRVEQAPCTSGELTLHSQKSQT